VKPTTDIFSFFRKFKCFCKKQEEVRAQGYRGSS